jgi:hypothetical protein
MKLTLLLLVALASCKQEASVTVTTSSAVATQSAPPPTPFTGTLTGERIMGAKGLAKPFDPWASAQAKLEGQMGKATLVKDGKKYMWGASQGDDCWYVEVEKQADNTVGMVMDPMRVSKGGAIFNWDDCLTAAGVRKDADEDPNAAGPPTDGKPITVQALRDGATKARSKWNGAKVVVRGLFLNNTTGTANGVEFASISITPAKADSKNAVGCSLADPKTTPKSTTQYTPITVAGTVDVSNAITGAGDRVINVGLKDCALSH